MPREADIALRARVTWVIAILSAVLVGHGFVLAVDIYSASSRSALASILQTREMDPLSAIVRPTLGGLDLTISLFVPLIAARVLCVEKERRTFGSLCLLEGSSERVVLKKLAAAFCASALAFSGEVFHAILVTAVSIAAAAWTRTLAQAASIGIVISLTSWAIDAAEGFAALAWLGGASAWSIERQLVPFQRGIVSTGSIVWLTVASAGAIVLALIGARFGVSRARRAVMAAVTIVLGGALMFSTRHPMKFRPAKSAFGRKPILRCSSTTSKWRQYAKPQASFLR